MPRRCLLVFLCALTGCKMFMTRLTTHFTETGWSAARAARWDGPECARVVATRQEVLDVTVNGGYYDRTREENLKEDPDHGAQILLAVCTRVANSQRGYAQWPKIAPRDPFPVYEEIDDRKIDVLAAAITAVHVSNSPRRSNGHGPRESIAIALLWRRVFPPGRVREELDRIGVPEGAKAAFLEQYRQIGDRLDPLIEPAARAILVELAVDVYKRRQKHYQDHADLYAKYDRLIEKVKTARDVPADRDRVARALEQLRSEFLDKCGRADCRALPLHGWITLELAKLHVLRRDLLAASVESTLIARRGSWTAGLPQAVYVEQMREIRRLDEIRNKYQRAVNGGMDERSAAELAGGKPVTVRGLIVPTTELNDFARALDGSNQVRTESGVVASVQGSGGERKVLFKKERHDNSIPYDCRRTNRISHIGTDGTISYEEDCKWRDVVDYVETHKPIAIPAAEASGIRGGDTITFVNLDGRARILEVKRGEKVVQIRADRVR